MNGRKYDYSEKEKEMFEFLGFSRNYCSQYPAQLIYRAAAIKVFIDNDTGSDVDSLRRCLRVIEDGGSPNRLTKEFDNLIDV